MKMEDKLERWNFACDYFGFQNVSTDFEIMAAVNAFCSSESPLCYFIDKKNIFFRRYQNDFLFSEFDSIYDFWRETYSIGFNRFCLQISECIKVCSAFGALEDAMKLIRYVEENNIRSEQLEMQL